MTLTSDDPNICTACIGDRRFNRWIRENGERGACGIDPAHGKARKVVAASDLAIVVDEYFRENYQRGEEEQYFDEDSDRPSYRQRGELYQDILGIDLGCEEDVVQALADHLPDATCRDIAQGDEAFYDDTGLYESTAEVARRESADQDEYWYENRFQFQWEDFCEKVQYQCRFFELKETLDALFGKVDEYAAGKIPPIYNLPIGQKIYRARLLGRDLTEQKLQAAPIAELGAPPKEKVGPGRMNVEFIPAFYGAFSEETAVAEIRPGIDEEVAIGEFEVREELKVFDFTAFARGGPEHITEMIRHTRYDFIKQMEKMISKPILPSDRQREYIATQIVAEYLNRYFKSDAVIYHSSMIKERDKDSRNIVILNRPKGFVGDDAPLIYKTHVVKQVENVRYTLFEWPF